MLLDEAEEVFHHLDRQGVDFVVIGGIAVNLWGISISTADIDMVVLLHRAEGFQRVFEVLRGRGYYPTALKMKDGRFLSAPRNFQRWSDFTRLADPPGDISFMRFLSGRQHRVDVNLTLTGLSPAQARENSLPTRLGRARARVISYEDLLQNKRAILRDPASDPEERLKAERHIQLLDLARRAARGQPIPEGKPQRRYRRIQGKMRLVEVTRTRGKERLRIVL